MADTKMSALPQRTLLAATDEFLNLAAGANYRSPLGNLTALLVAQGLLDGTAIENAAYDATAWNGVTDKAASKDALRDKIVAMDAAIAAAGAGAISDVAYDAGTWDGVTTEAPSKNAVRDKIVSMDAAIAAAGASASDVAFAASWDGVTTIPPSKNAVYDKIIAMDALITAATPSDAAYDEAAWNGSLLPATKNAIRDKFVTVDAAFTALNVVSAPITLLSARTTNGTPGGVDWQGGPGLLSVYGTFGTATVQIAYSPDGGTTYIDTEGALISGANATLLLSFPAGKVRATVASADGTTNLNAKLESTQ